MAKKKKNKRPHLKDGHNRRANMKLGFDTKKEYVDFCKHLVELYEGNESMTISSLCKYVQREYNIDLYYEKARSILHEFNATMKKPYEYSKERTKLLQITINKKDHDFLQSIKKSYGSYARRDAMDFVMCMFRGRPTKSLILWVDELKPVFFLFDDKVIKYRVFAENMSKMEQKILEELMVEVEEVDDLEPIIRYAKSKNLKYWGHNE